jgi:predicted transposase YdaD
VESLIIAMDQEPIHQPHDKLFKTAFRHPPTSAAFLKTQLPPPIVQAIDWSQLSLLPGSFIDSHLRHSESDLLFNAPFLNSSYETNLYLLFEHQSTEDPALGLRLLRYMIRIWEKHRLDSQKSPLPVILPIVICQNDRPWPLKPTLDTLFKVPEELMPSLRAHIPNFDFLWLQLAEIPFDRILGTPMGILVLRTLKAARSGELLSDWVWDENQLKLLPQSMLECLWTYLVHADLDPDHLNRKISMLREPELRTVAMTYAEKLHQEGRMEGRMEGRIEGRTEGHIEGIMEGRIEGHIQGLQTAIVANLEFRFSGIPDGLAEAIASVKDLERLHALQRLSLTCATVDDFISEL